MTLRVLLAAAAVAVASSPARAADPPPLNAYADNEAYSVLDMSPDGRRIAYLSRSGGKRVVLLRTDDGPASPVLSEGRVEITDVNFVDDQHLLILTRGVNQGRVLPQQTLTQGSIYNLATGKTVTVLQNTSGVAPVIGGGDLYYGQTSDGHPTLYVTGLDLDGPRFNLYRVDLDTGRGAIVDSGSLTSKSWVTTGDGRLVAKSTYDDETKIWTLFGRTAGEWSVLRRERTTQLPYLYGLGRSDSRLLASSEAGFIELSTATGQALPDGPPKSAAAIKEYGTGLLIGVELEGDKPAYQFFDQRASSAWSKVAGAFPGKFVTLKKFDAKFEHVLVTVDAPSEPDMLYKVDVATGRARIMGRLREQLPMMIPFGPVKPLAFTAGDGLVLKGNIVLPPGRDPVRLPAIVWAHGPDEHAAAGFDDLRQAFASRGYAVLEVDNRGSDVGELWQAGRGQLGRGMLTDISDGVAAAVQQGVIDPARVCIVGIRWGGYAALAGVTLQNGVYRCAVGINAVSDLTAHLSEPGTTPYNTSWGRVRFARRLAGSERPREPRVLAVSPLAQAAAASAPVLLIHREDIERLGPEESLKMDAVLKAARKPSEVVVIKGDPTTYSHVGPRTTMLEAAMAFILRVNPPGS